MTAQQKIITITLSALSVAIILDSLQFGHALMMFLLAGVIPGTNVAIDGATALSLFAALSGFTLARLVLSAKYSLPKAAILAE